MAQLSKKIILTGQVLGGKTSILKRYVYNKFYDQYYTTIGAQIDEKHIEIGEYKLKLIIWDSSQEKKTLSYFLGAAGVVYIVDLSNPSLSSVITEDILSIKNRLPNIPLLVVGNKKDMLSEAVLRKTIDRLPVRLDLITSAKTGENIQLIFDMISEMIIASHT
jgi:small GTP-binding protein